MAVRALDTINSVQVVEGVGAEMVHLFVSLERDTDGYPPFEAEELDAEPLASGDYRITGIPVFVYGLAMDDVVSAVQVPGDETLWVTGVVQSSAHWTARVLPRNPEELDAARDQFVRLGCNAFSTPFGLVAIDIPPQVDDALVIATLNTGRDAGTWDFDLGIDPTANGPH